MKTIKLTEIELENLQLYLHEYICENDKIEYGIETYNVVEKILDM